MSRSSLSDITISRRAALIGSAAALMPALAFAQDQETEGGDGGDAIQIVEVPS